MSYNNQYFPMYPQQIVRVNGENGARTYQLPPNSSALLLDDTAPLVWLVQTDGAGYKTVSPFSISQYEPEPQPDFKMLMDRLTRLEERINAEPHRATIEQQEYRKPECNPSPADEQQPAVRAVYARQSRQDS